MKIISITINRNTRIIDKLNIKNDDFEVYMKGIDHSYYYEGYTTFKTEEL